MIGPLLPATPQVASAVAEPSQARQAIPAAENPLAGIAVETPRAPRPIPEDTGQRGIEGAIAAKEQTIRMTEEVARRDRSRISRYPVEIATLQSAYATDPDETVRAKLRTDVQQLQSAFGAAEARLAQHNATWPNQRQALEAEIAGYRTQLAQSGYRQL